MGTFAEYICNGGTRPSDTDIAAVLERYPWFMTARIMLSETQQTPDPLVILHRISYPKRQAQIAAEPIRTEPTPAEQPPQQEQEVERQEQKPIGTKPAQDEVIETFLSKGEYRIIPDESTPEFDAAKDSVVLDLPDDMLSEELAEIYLAQGLNAQAKEIYERLSLLNPEKSVYFAEIIGKIGLR